MKYTQEFIDKVKDAYADNYMIIGLVESHSELLGEYLYDSSQLDISPYTVLHTPYEKLMEYARNAQKKIEIYTEYVCGRCYEGNGFEECMCPALYMQMNRDKNDDSLKEVVCKENANILYFNKCKNWENKSKCWEKYHALIVKDD